MTLWPSDAAGRRRLARRALRKKPRRERAFRNGERLWRGKGLRESAQSLADGLKLRLAGCSGSSVTGWIVEIDDVGVPVTVTYRMALADNLIQLQEFLRKHVSAPPWGLKVVFRFFMGEEKCRTQFPVEWLRTDGRGDDVGVQVGDERVRLSGEGRPGAGDAPA